MVKTERQTNRQTNRQPNRENPSTGCTANVKHRTRGQRYIWPVVQFFIYFWENLTLTFDLDQRSRFGQSHQHFGNLMRLNGLYLGTKYEVCREIASEIFTHFLEKFDLDLQSRSSALRSLNAP